MRIYGSGSADAVTDTSGAIQPGVNLLVYRQDGTRVMNVWNHAKQDYADHATTDELGRPRFSVPGDDAPLSLLLDFEDGTDPNERWVVLASDAFQTLETSAQGALGLAREALAGLSLRPGVPEVSEAPTGGWSAPRVHVLTDGSSIRARTRQPPTGNPTLIVERRSAIGIFWDEVHTEPGDLEITAYSIASHGGNVVISFDSTDAEWVTTSGILSSTDGGLTFTRETDEIPPDAELLRTNIALTPRPDPSWEGSQFPHPGDRWTLQNSVEVEYVQISDHPEGLNAGWYATGFGTFDDQLRLNMDDYPVGPEGVTISLWVKADQGVSLWAQYIDDGAKSLSLGAISAGDAGQWTRLSGHVAQGDLFRVYLRGQSGGAATVAGLLIEHGNTTGDYFDGAFEVEGVRCDWSGVPFASASTMSTFGSDPFTMPVGRGDFFWAPEGEDDLGTLYVTGLNRSSGGVEIYSSVSGGTWNWDLVAAESDASYREASLVRIDDTWVWMILEAIGLTYNYVVRRADDVAELATAEGRRVLSGIALGPDIQLLGDGGMVTPTILDDSNFSMGIATSRDKGATWAKTQISPAQPRGRGNVYVERDGVAHYVTADQQDRIIDYPLISSAINPGGTIAITSGVAATQGLFPGQLIFETDTHDLRVFTGSTLEYVQAGSTGWQFPLDDAGNFGSFGSPNGDDNINWGFIREGGFVTIALRLTNIAPTSNTTAETGNFTDVQIGVVTDPRFLPSHNVHFLMTASGIRSTMGRLYPDGRMTWTHSFESEIIIPADVTWDINVTYRAAGPGMR